MYMYMYIYIYVLHFAAFTWTNFHLIIPAWPIFNFPQMTYMSLLRLLF